MTLSFIFAGNSKNSSIKFLLLYDKYCSDKSSCISVISSINAEASSLAPLHEICLAVTSSNAFLISFLWSNIDGATSASMSSRGANRASNLSL